MIQESNMKLIVHHAPQQMTTSLCLLMDVWGSRMQNLFQSERVSWHHCNLVISPFSYNRPLQNHRNHVCKHRSVKTGFSAVKWRYFPCLASKRTKYSSVANFAYFGHECLSRRDFMKKLPHTHWIEVQNNCNDISDNCELVLQLATSDRSEEQKIVQD